MNGYIEHSECSDRRSIRSVLVVGSNKALQCRDTPAHFSLWPPIGRQRPFRSDHEHTLTAGPLDH